MVPIDRAEHGIDVLICDGDFDVVLAEEVAEELAKLAAIKGSVGVSIVVLEVLLDLLAELLLVSREGLKLGQGSIELTGSEIGRIDIHRVCLFYLLTNK